MIESGAVTLNRGAETYFVAPPGDESVTVCVYLCLQEYEAHKIKNTVSCGKNHPESGFMIGGVEMSLGERESQLALIKSMIGY